MSQRGRFLSFEVRGKRFKVPVRQTGPRGNKHFNVRRPEGPECGQPLIHGRDGMPVSWCAEIWQPICPNRACPGHRVPKAVIRSERRDVSDKRYPANRTEAKDGGRGEYRRAA